MMRAWLLLPLLVATSQGGSVMPAGTPVTVYAVVEDARSRPLSDIVSSDVEVSIDGKVGEPPAVTCGEPPLTLVVLIDVTASLTTQLPGRDATLRKATERLIDTLRPEDRVRVGVVAATPAISLTFLSDRKAIASAAGTLLDHDERERYGPSPVWDAIDLAISALEPEPRRRAVVIFTDGRTTGNRLGYTDVAAHAVRSGVAINVVSPFGVILIPQSPIVLARVRPQVPLGRLADITGGVLVSSVPDLSAHPENVLLTVLPRIRTACAISFSAPPSEAPLQRLDVRVNRPGAVVHVPQGLIDRALRSPHRP